MRTEPTCLESKDFESSSSLFWHPIPNLKSMVVLTILCCAVPNISFRVCVSVHGYSIVDTEKPQETVYNKPKGKVIDIQALVYMQRIKV